MTDTAVDLVSDNLAALSGFLDGMPDIIASFTDEQAGRVRVELDDLLTAARGAVGAVDLRLIQLLSPGESFPVPGGGQVIVETRGKQSTHGERLALRVAALAADEAFDKETGEIYPPAEIARRTAMYILEMFGLDTPSTQFRTGEVKKHGWRASEFRDFEDGQPRVRFMR